MLGFGGTPDASKVLRIGVVRDGKVVHERLIRPGQNVTVGESPRNTFVFQNASLPNRFLLFQAKGGKYSLNITESMSGKIALESGLQDIAKVRQSPDVVRKGDTAILPLGDSGRGKVVIGDVTVLFQFVPAPPESARMVNRQDFRPKLFDEDDPVFVGALSVCLAMAAVLMIWAWNTPPVETTSLEEIPDRFVEIIKAPDEPDEPEVVEQAIENPDAKPVETEEKKPEEKKPEKKPETAKEKEAAEAAAKAKKREDVMKKSKLLAALIGTRGDTKSSGTVEDLFADSDASIGSIQDALQTAGGVEVATADNLGVKKGGSGSREDAKIGDLAKSGGGSADVGAGPATKVVGKASLGAVDAGSSEHAGSIKSVVNKKKNQVQYCYEQRLKENPNIGGRLAISIDIAAGRVTNVRIDENATGDKAIEGCVQSKVRRWRFSQDVTESIFLPFALSAS
ncbi:MAG: AgmX/PglI C-terminal domain-containing protein [Myxococcota bacterium]|nr:AgmX/PglI C-terminal domain-containing protein [Myxococcota bacterium]MEC9390593.1 AgmX/PglI C-terminal domain-containing protein [Myxococcota bacterium]